MLRRRLSAVNTSAVSWDEVANHVNGLSQAELVRAAESAAKRAILDGSDSVRPLALSRPWTSAARRAVAEGPPERPGRTPLPHIVVPWAASDQAYKGRRSGARRSRFRAIGDRQGHAARLSGELESARDAARGKLAEVSPDVAADGFALSVESWSDEPGYKLAVQSLDTSGAKLLSVVPGTDQSPERAVVWLPFGAVGAFFTKIEQFATETTIRGKPRNQALVANIAELRLAVLHDLWQEPEQFPDADEVRWWEVWLARLAPTPAARRRKRATLDSFRLVELVGGPGAVLRAVAAERAWQVVTRDCSPSRTT